MLRASASSRRAFASTSNAVSVPRRSIRAANFMGSPRFGGYRRRVRYGGGITPINFVRRRGRLGGSRSKLIRMIPPPHAPPPRRLPQRHGDEADAGDAPRD